MTSFRLTPAITWCLHPMQSNVSDVRQFWGNRTTAATPTLLRKHCPQSQHRNSFMQRYTSRVASTSTHFCTTFQVSTSLGKYMPTLHVQAKLESLCYHKIQHQQRTLQKPRRGDSLKWGTNTSTGNGVQGGDHTITREAIRYSLVTPSPDCTDTDCCVTIVQLDGTCSIEE